MTAPSTASAGDRAPQSDPVESLDEGARRAFAGTESSWIVDAAFGRYAREASDYRGGGRPRPRFAAGE